MSEPYKPKPGQPDKPADFSLVDPADQSAPLDQRARSYLHANCAHCHREHGGGSALIDLRKEMSLTAMRVVNEPPMLGSFDIDNARIIFPADPSRSVLLYRMAKTGGGRMPHIISDVVDQRGVALIGQWIAAMPETGGHSLAKVDLSDKTKLNELLKTPQGALAELYTLLTSDIPKDRRQREITDAMAHDSIFAHDLFDHFSGRDMAPAPKLGMKFDRAKLLAMKGDVVRGRNVFQNIAQCAACHVASGVQGRDFGPDLSHIAAKYNKKQLLENIEEPSTTLADGFIAYNVVTNDGDLITGFLIKRDAKEVVIKDATLQQIHIPAAHMKSITAQSLSIMPPGLLANLEPQQAADLLEMLQSQK
jgi:putative heme-binding domain-containing protein